MLFLPFFTPRMFSNNFFSAIFKLFFQDLKFDPKRMMVNKSLGETILHRSAKNNLLVS